MIEIRCANIHDADIVAELVVELLTELVGVTYEKKNYINVTKELLEAPCVYDVFLAFDGTQRCVGMLSVTQSHSIYAGGKFGIIQELYVLPEFRSYHVGHHLINAAIEHGKKNNWFRLEVGAPDAIKWHRTVSFYQREGFKEIGPRLSLKLV